MYCQLICILSFKFLSHYVNTNVILQHIDKFSSVWGCTILYPHKQYTDCLFPQSFINRVCYQNFGERCYKSGVLIFIFIIMNDVLHLFQ